MKISQEDWRELLNQINKGDQIEGVVIEVRHFGVFVDLGLKFKGLALVPHLGNKILNSIDDYPQINEKHLFKVLDFSRSGRLEHRYISLSLCEQLPLN